MHLQLTYMATEMTAAGWVNHAARRGVGRQAADPYKCEDPGIRHPNLASHTAYSKATSHRGVLVPLPREEKEREREKHPM